MFQKIALLAALLAVTACSQTWVDWVSVKPETSRTAPEKIRVFYTEKAVAKAYVVVAKYNATSNSSDFKDALDEVRTRASKDGCDAILYASSWRSLSTFFSWASFFIPVNTHGGQIDFIGIRFTDNKPEAS